MRKTFLWKYYPLGLLVTETEMSQQSKQTWGEKNKQKKPWNTLVFPSGNKLYLICLNRKGLGNIKRDWE